MNVPAQDAGIQSLPILALIVGLRGRGMATIRLLKHYGSLGPGDTMTPQIDEVAAILVRHGTAEYVQDDPAIPADDAGLTSSEADVAVLTRRQAKLQAHGRKP